MQVLFEQLSIKCVENHSPEDSHLLFHFSIFFLLPVSFLRSMHGAEYIIYARRLSFVLLTGGSSDGGERTHCASYGFFVVVVYIRTIPFSLYPTAEQKKIKYMMKVAHS